MSKWLAILEAAWFYCHAGQALGDEAASGMHLHQSPKLNSMSDQSFLSHLVEKGMSVAKHAWMWLTQIKYE